MSERFGSRYLLEEVVGRGGMGRVYRARREPDGEQVAIKVLREDLADQPEVVSRFVNEREILRSISHPHVVRVHDLIVDDGRLGIVMDFFEDGHLRRTVPPPVAPAIAAGLMAQVADGLAAVHAAGVIHRDLKPENVLARAVHGREFRLQLTDFGISRLTGASTTRLTSMIGTPGYMAPEMGLGDKVTSATDVYALGVMLYEWCTGRPVFQADNPVALIRAHAQDPVPTPVSMPAGMTSLLGRLLGKNPGDRPSAADAGEELRALAPELIDLRPFDVDERATMLTPGSGVPVTRKLAGSGAPRATNVALTPPPDPVLSNGRATVHTGSGRAETIIRPTPSAPNSTVIAGIGPASDGPPPKRPRAVMALVAGVAAILVASIAVVTTRAMADRSPATVAQSASPSPKTAPTAPPAPSHQSGVAPSGASPSNKLPAAQQVQAAPAPARIGSTKQTTSTKRSVAAAPAPAPSSAAPSRSSAPSAKTVIESSPVAVPKADGSTCYGTAIDGGFTLGAGQARVAGGPNYTSAACSGIHLKLYSATYVTFARACLETSSESITRCGGWVRLSYPDTWDTLLTSVPAGSRWQLQMYGDAAQSVRFRYTA